MYQIGAASENFTMFRDVLQNAVASPFRRIKAVIQNRTEPDLSRTIWALRDVTFEIGHGEAVGLIGRNGAGKSTLLKILSRITAPTSGRIGIFGRVGSLLEVGTGFHPELTGRENVFLNGAILGMRRHEIRQRFDEIVAFAEIEKFIDTPVKRYSSGMYMRLAFAVAAHLEPEILIVDEVLAVGDAAFQRKCLGKMNAVAHEGRTVLFVSHNLAAVENLCQRGIVLDRGQVIYIGSQTDAISEYVKSVGQNVMSMRERTDRAGTGEIHIVGIEAKDLEGHSLDTVQTGQDIDLYLYFEKDHNFRSQRVICGISVKTSLDVPVFLQHNRLTGDEFGVLPDTGAFVCRFSRLPLPPSTYWITFTVSVADERLDSIQNAVSLTVVDGDFFGSGEVPPISHGVSLVNAQWRVEAQSAPVPVPSLTS